MVDYPEPNPVDPPEFYAIELACAHTVYTPVMLRLQYPDDSHMILCPECAQIKDAKPLAIPTAWQAVTSVREVRDNGTMSDVLTWVNCVMSRSIMRLQPSVPSNRVRPFPYVGKMR